MNINEFNRIKTINVEERVAEVVAGSGTFKEICDKVYADEIIPIVNGAGQIVGLSYDSKVTSLVEDNIAQVAFEKRYRGIDIMGYTLKALELKADRKVISEIQEDADGIRVILDGGEVVVIKERCCYNPYEAPRCAVELPSEVTITYDEADSYGIEDGPDEDKMTLKYLRDKYDHYLSGEHPAPSIEYNDDEQAIKVTNIHWGRKR